MPINFRKTVFKGVAARLDQCPNDNIPEVVMSGRSNSGKSTMINLLAGQSKLARTSNTPGKTRMVIYFLVDDRFYLTDLPGYGFARVSRQTREEFSALTDQYLSSGRPITMILHLMDIRHKPGRHDEQMMEWLSANNIPWRIVLTKCDKLSRQQQIKQLDLLKSIPVMKSAPEPLLFSAHNKTGLEELRCILAEAFGDSPVKND
jgi:GTP-binding protein